MTIRATFELEPEGSAATLAFEASSGLATVVSDDGGRAVLDFPDDVWGADPTLLVSALVAGEATEMAAFTRCRLVDLQLPAGALPGPAFGADPRIAVGVIVKPSLGLSPGEVAVVVAAATGAGATFVKDDEKLGDPSWCPFEERVRAVARVLPPGVTYCANVTGPAESLLDRAWQAVHLGATGVLVSGAAQGLGSVLALREATLGVPILVHRAGSGPWVRNASFGTTGAVLVRLYRLCGADHVIAGTVTGKLFDSDAEIAANLAAAQEPLDGAAPSWALLGGGRQALEVAGPGTVLVLGSGAYAGPGGIAASVRALVEASR
ncbi:MAG: RuBisCO large subunit C-terminal-like domain-containing protein [Acidimicrobiales bacterium]